MITLKGKNIRMPKPCVLAVGKFECIHLGHKALISEMERLAHGNMSNSSLASALVMFEPHPYRVLSDPEYKPLFTGCEREYVARKLGIDYLLKYPFDQDFAVLSPEDFCRMLFENLQARVVVVGEGYRFGYKRAGTVETLRQIAGVYNAQVHVVTHHRAPQEVAASAYNGSSKTSTSSIRALLSANRLPEAEDLLGYPFFIMGEVVPGRQIGRSIGFPTINLHPQEDKFLPSDGVYATRAIITNTEGERGKMKQSYYGITNVGLRPTVEINNAPRIVETHLLDYENGELYGRQVRVEFLRFIRPERKFEH